MKTAVAPIVPVSIAALALLVAVAPGDDPEAGVPEAAADDAAAEAAEWWRYPPEEAIETVEIEGADPLALVVDKRHRLPAGFVPDGLVTIPPDVIRTIRPTEVKRELLEPLRRLAEAAKADGVDLAVLSGYRSFERQARVYASWVRREGGDRAAADRYSARPGHSEHQLGTVVDFTTAEIDDGIGPRFHATAACRWLGANAPKFGFTLSYPEGKEGETGFLHEGWHWRFRGKPDRPR